ncbi:MULTISPECIES: nuclease-related domain-containing protein [Bacillaceae]|uniref:nuclease-related domain-containing protein n=1 Tax=Bacillaceae TaxID=186817 RepID=UPI000BFC0B9D|nr:MULTISPECIES: nuclease-related domain-containing protein [Bacillaceae]PGT81213.1 nuclease [Bacillus sp. AFS040349]UGB30261.1 NERD domain-containing protein [Metabacillus sp. B2-18]
MIIKDRQEPIELKLFKILYTRMELTEKEKFRYLNLQKGFEGEVAFDRAAESILEERYMINDLLLEVNNSYFQIDSLIISQDVIHLLDIKNYEGDCYLEGDKLYSVTTNREYKNPIIQLKRSATLLRQLLQTLKLNFLVEPSVIFINPEFTLYQAPMDQPIILPTQVQHFIRSFNKTPSRLNDHQKKLAQTLLSLHKTKNPHTNLPEYYYDQLQKGIYCNSCYSYLVYRNNKSYLCKRCGEKEAVGVAILRNIKEFEILFPEGRITTESIYEWCNTDISRKTLMRILREHYTAHGNARRTYYK